LHERLNVVEVMGQLSGQCKTLGSEPLANQKRNRRHELAFQLGFSGRAGQLSLPLVDDAKLGFWARVREGAKSQNECD